jgi:hypothetical protein
LTFYPGNTVKNEHCLASAFFSAILSVVVLRRPVCPPGGKESDRMPFRPGIVLAGTSIGSGEWLFGPAVTAQYGAALLWLALLSILFQGFVDRLSLAVLLIFWT